MATVALNQILREDLQRSDMHIKEMKAEIELLQSLHHPGIAKFYGGGLEPRPFIVMELLEGGTLNQRLGFAAKYSGKRTVKTRRSMYLHAIG